MPYRVLKQSKIERRAKPGTIIYGFWHTTYGVLALDNKVGPERPYGAFTLKENGDYPFFTMPMRDVERIENDA